MGNSRQPFLIQKEDYPLPNPASEKHQIDIQTIEYEADGRSLIGRLAIPIGTPHPCAGVLIAHEGTGLDELQLQRADRLAALGYVAFALDYHGGGKMIADRGKALARLAELSNDPERMRLLSRAGLEVLLQQSEVDPGRIAAIGYCFGGAMVLELARGGADLKAVVGFHPRLSTKRPLDSKNITGRVLVCLGAEDTQIPLAERLDFEQEMRTAGVDWRMNLYGGAHHCFTHPWVDHLGLEDFRYDELADKRSWQAMLDLLGEVFVEQS